jgi:uncharacterized protein (DUF58 family)
MKKTWPGRTDPPASPTPPAAPRAARPVRWSASARTRSLATVALLAPGRRGPDRPCRAGAGGGAGPGALALMPRRRPAGELVVDVALSGSRCFEGEDVTVTATGPRPAGRRRFAGEAHDRAGAGAAGHPRGDRARGLRTFLPDGADPAPSARWTVRPGRWGRYSPGAVLVSGRAGRRGFQTSVRVELDQLEIFSRAERMRPRLVPAELLRRIGEHTGRAVGDGVEFVGLRPYQPGDQLRDVNRAVSIRRGQLHVNRRAAARAADLVVMIDSLDEPGPVAERTPGRGGARVRRAGHRLPAGRRPGRDRGARRRAALARAGPRDAAVLPHRRDDAARPLRDEPPVSRRPAQARRDGLALRLWRLDRAATRAALRDFGVPVLCWDAGAELDGVLAPLRQPPPGVRRPVAGLASTPAAPR